MDTVAGTVETMNKESWHQTIWREAAFISAGTGSASSYPQAEPRAQQGLSYIHYKAGGSQHPGTAAMGAIRSHYRCIQDVSYILIYLCKGYPGTIL